MYVYVYTHMHRVTIVRARPGSRQLRAKKRTMVSWRGPFPCYSLPFLPKVLIYAKFPGRFELFLGFCPALGRSQCYARVLLEVKIAYVRSERSEYKCTVYVSNAHSNLNANMLIMSQ